MTWLDAKTRVALNTYNIVDEHAVIHICGRFTILHNDAREQAAITLCEVKFPETDIDRSDQEAVPTCIACAVKDLTR